jgi:hypothetical protein
MNAQDRCDRCGAQALVSVSNTPNHVPFLWFCGHHFGLYWPQLMIQGWEVIEDTREALREAERLVHIGGDHA